MCSLTRAVLTRRSRVGWLRVELGYEVIAVAVDVGQDVDFDELRRRAIAAGAVEVVVVDAREELLR